MTETPVTRRFERGFARVGGYSRLWNGCCGAYQELEGRVMDALAMLLETELV